MCVDAPTTKRWSHQPRAAQRGDSGGGHQVLLAQTTNSVSGFGFRLGRWPLGDRLLVDLKFTHRISQLVQLDREPSFTTNELRYLDHGVTSNTSLTARFSDFVEAGSS